MAPSAWLLLRGLTREQRHWDPFPAVLERRLGVPTLRLDMPGFGTESARPAPASIRAITEDLRARWEPLRPKGQVGLLAISMGGMVASDWVARYPEAFSQVVLINSSAGNVSPFWRRMRPSLLPLILASVRAKTSQAREQMILRITTRTYGEDPNLAAVWARYRDEYPLKPRAALAQLWAAATFRAPKRLPIPSLVLTSHGDRLTDWRCSQSLARRYGSAFFVHPDGGHDLPLDAPDWVSDQIKAWLDA